MPSRRSTVAPLRVVMATPRYLPSMGGVEHHVHEVAPRLAEAGLSVTVLTTDTQGTLPQVEERDGVRIRRVPAWPTSSDYFFAPALHHVIRREAWDLVHVQSYHTFVAPLAMSAAIRARIPFVLTFHGGGHSSRIRSRSRRAQLLLLRPLLARAERLVAVARFEIELYARQLRLPKERFVLIPNGANLPEHDTSGGGRRIGDLIVSVGRLERYKGHHRIVAALPEILLRRPEARLWIAGVGPYEEELRRLAAELEVSDRVEISVVPAEDRKLMARRLSEASLVVLLSEFETHPIAVIEALALGVPALVSDTAGLRELAEQGLARAIRLDSSPQDVAAAVVENLGRTSDAVPLRLPTWDQCASEHLTLYRSVITAGGTPEASGRA
jgi:glycogen synthase